MEKDEKLDKWGISLDKHYPPKIKKSHKHSYENYGKDREKCCICDFVREKPCPQ